MRHRFILTLADYASRYAEAVPLQEIDVEIVPEALVDIYSWLGIPGEAWTMHLGMQRQVWQFMSHCMKEIWGLLGIKQKVKPYHLICNNLVERLNATL
ncbi:Zinc finger protein [Plakobranchus ocellatus]|uniref:Zinc finger protein n=1 Tax=Plakobranchus ocellatus TaxID=259542 RepID=A0AAV4D294_9GAST|nr:Zinc finger protein [Plakobranchus ocellatus]